MSRRILVVEDQEDNRQILRDLLDSAGYEMTEAWDGEAGVSAAKEQRPDLILMDIQPKSEGLVNCSFQSSSFALKGRHANDCFCAARSVSV
jgi:CheY-like chemotaxis protein